MSSGLEKKSTLSTEVFECLVDAGEVLVSNAL